MTTIIFGTDEAQKVAADRALQQLYEDDIDDAFYEFFHNHIAQLTISAYSEDYDFYDVLHGLAINMLREEWDIVLVKKNVIEAVENVAELQWALNHTLTEIRDAEDALEEAVFNA